MQISDEKNEKVKCVKSRRTKSLRAGKVDIHINTASQKLHKNTLITTEMIKISKENES